MLEATTIELMVRVCPNYHLVRVGKGHLRKTFSVCTCKDCMYAENGVKVKDSHWLLACKRLRLVGIPAGLRTVASYATCDHARFATTQYDMKPEELPLKATETREGDEDANAID